MIDHGSHAHNLSSCNIEAWTGFKPMTPVILVQCSANWTIWELATLWVRNIPVECEDYKWIYESSLHWFHIGQLAVISQPYDYAINMTTSLLWLLYSGFFT